MDVKQGDEPSVVPQGSAGITLMPPPAPRPAKRKQIVLDEDEWVAKMEGIIERDFFPELVNLQDKVQWLEVSSLTSHVHPSLRRCLSLLSTI